MIAASRSGGGPAAAKAPAACRTLAAVPPPAVPVPVPMEEGPATEHGEACCGSCRDGCCELLAAIARFGRDDPSGGAADDIGSGWWSCPDDTAEGAMELAVVILEMGARRRERFSA